MQFSILGVFGASWALTWKHWIRTYGVGLALCLIAILIGLGFGAAKNFGTSGFAVFLKAVALILLFGMSMSAAFNYWVRLAAFGTGRAFPGSVGKFLSAALVNFVKFILIVIIIGIITLVITAGLSMMGLGGERLQPTAEDISSVEGFLAFLSASFTLGQMTLQVISILVACFVYSFFSANLTGTALGDDREGLEHPHTVDFAVALMLIELVVIIPIFALIAVGLPLVSIVLNVVLAFPMMAAIAIAHGVRYRMCIAARDEEPAVN
ncbi:hypothetical protein [Gimibacter soli]|uniref:Uncharacterized protein n=1 Tax=Gimibacter soli TaxID=3024400 RepID=A0AAE9XLL7_9PROT|nr:hypothetical protein [Gimibacter soli]WCL53138.1 hypothetical protein PH603_11375 [Gimibacter soli]